MFRIPATILTFSLIVSYPAAADDVVDTALAAGKFTTLAKALAAADLVDALRGDGPFTVLAPTDDAFARLPQGTVQELLKPANRDRLRAILTYHVIAGAVDASAAVGARSAATLQGEAVRFSIRDGRLTVNDQVGVIATDIACSNGVIHVIDAVLLPPIQDPPGRKVLGVYVETPGEALAAQLGIDPQRSLLITEVTRRGPARAVGVEKYDVIVHIDGQPASNSELQRAKESRAVGDEVDLDLIRRGKRVSLKVPVALETH